MRAQSVVCEFKAVNWPYERRSTGAEVSARSAQSTA